MRSLKSSRGRLIILLCLFILVGVSMAPQIVAVHAYSTVDTNAFNYQAESVTTRHVWYAVGRWWVFYTQDGYTLNYKSSSDGGSTWSIIRTVTSGGLNVQGILNGSEHAEVFDGTYFHVTGDDEDSNELRYIRGTPSGATGIITFTARQNVGFSGFAQHTYHLVIAVDTSGYPWITMTRRSDAKPWVTKSSHNDGTWLTAGGFPYQLDNSLASYHWRTSIVALTGNKMYVTYGNDQPGYRVYGKLYNAGWGAVEDVSMFPISKPEHSLVAVVDDLYCLFSLWDGADSDLIFNKRLYSDGFWGVSPVVVASTLPLLSPSTLSYSVTESALIGVYYNSAVTKLRYVKMPWLVDYAVGATITDWETVTLTDANQINAIPVEGNQSIGVIWEKTGTNDLFFGRLTMTAPVTTAPPDLNFTIPVVIPADSMNVTWYMRSDTHTIFGNLSYKLLPTNTIVAAMDTRTKAANNTVSYGVKVYAVDGLGDVSELTLGSVSAIVTLDSNLTGLYAATWVCPEYGTFAVSAVKVEVYQRFGSDAWSLRRIFMTKEELLIRLPAATWTFYYWLNRTYAGGTTTSIFKHGEPAYSSMVDLVYQRMWPWDVMAYYLSRNDFMGFLVTPWYWHIGDLFYGFIVLFLSVTSYNHFEDIRVVMVIAWLFGGVGGALPLLIPGVALNISYLILAFALAVTMWKLFR